MEKAVTSEACSTHGFNPRFSCLSRLLKHLGGHLKALKLFKTLYNVALKRLASAVQLRPWPPCFHWSDVNLAHATVRVSHKPDRGWTPKAYKEREIPIPAKLAKSLKAWKAKADKTCGLVFPTAGCKPKLDFLDCLKVVAERAKLDEDLFRLHKFRATFATRCLWAGVDLRTVQQWLGHSDMESTMRYLKPSRSQHVRDKVNEIFA
jgi:site-specific recombinase XerC